MRREYSVLLLVADIKGLTFNFEGHKHPLYNLYDTKSDFYRYYQTGQTKNPQYLETFNNKFSVIDSYGGAIGNELVMSKHELAG